MALTPKQSKDRALASKYRAQASISREKAKLAKETTKAAEYKTAQAQANAELAMKKNEDYEKRIAQRDEQLERNKSLSIIHGIGNVAGGLETIGRTLTPNSIPSKIQTGNGYTSFIAPQKCYVLAKTKKVLVPLDYASIIGKPCMQTYYLYELIGKGYTLCEAFHLEGIPATSKELQAIDEYLKNGVIL